MFICPKDLEELIDFNVVCNNINLLLTGDLKYTSINNQCSLALKKGDISSYINKMIAKTYYKNVLYKGDV